MRNSQDRSRDVVFCGASRYVNSETLRYDAGHSGDGCDFMGGCERCEGVDLQWRSGVGSGCVGVSTVCRDSVVVAIGMMIRDRDEIKSHSGRITVLSIVLMYAFSSIRR